MGLKLSKYNFYVDYNGEFRFYNSLVGTNSLLIFRNKYYDLIKNNFNTFYRNPNIVEILKKYGYLVDECTDEELIKKQKLYDIIHQNKLFLVIMPTEDCNFRCVYCYEKHEPVYMNTITQNSIVEYVRRNIKYYTGLNIAWFGGEPLIAYDIIEKMSKEFINICRVARKPFKAGITTNGYLLTKEVYLKLLKLHVLDFQITIDGLKYTHDIQRPLKNGEGSFDIIIKNLNEIKQISHETSGKLTIRTNFSKSIISRIDDYFKFINDLFKDASNFELQINKVSNWGGDSIHCFLDEIIDEREYHKLFEIALKNKINYNIGYHLVELNGADFKCYAAKKNSYTIDAKGYIYKCTSDFDMEENKVGKVFDDGTFYIDYYKEAIWTNIDYFLNNKKCKKCHFGGSCLESPCPKNVILNHYKSICPRTNGNVDDILKLLDYSNFIVYGEENEGK